MATKLRSLEQNGDRIHSKTSHQENEDLFSFQDIFVELLIMLDRRILLAGIEAKSVFMNFKRLLIFIYDPLNFNKSFDLTAKEYFKIIFF